MENIYRHKQEWEYFNLRLYRTIIRYRRKTFFVMSLTLFATVKTIGLGIGLLKGIFIGPQLVRHVGPNHIPQERHEFERNNLPLSGGLWR